MKFLKFTSIAILFLSISINAADEKPQIESHDEIFDKAALDTLMSQRPATQITHLYTLPNDVLEYLLSVVDQSIEQLTALEQPTASAIRLKTNIKHVIDNRVSKPVSKSHFNN